MPFLLPHITKWVDMTGGLTALRFLTLIDRTALLLTKVALKI